jgi:Mg2+ and Co2+ transporter CorA
MAILLWKMKRFIKKYAGYAFVLSIPITGILCMNADKNPSYDWHSWYAFALFIWSCFTLFVIFTFFCKTSKKISEGKYHD